ncbi:MAG: ABC transporter permease subunit [Bacillus subtilis]|nr:ABC transporter permease subunit [Bacillus subtilis]
MRQYLLTIPDDIIDSARIDGASEWQIFLRIIIPNAKPAIATLGNLLVHVAMERLYLALDFRSFHRRNKRFNWRLRI